MLVCRLVLYKIKENLVNTKAKDILKNLLTKDWIVYKIKICTFVQLKINNIFK